MQDVNKQLLERWAAFGKAMQKAGSELPRHLIVETEQAIAAAEQAQADPVELRSVFDEMFDYSVDPTDDISREWLWRFSKGLVGRLSSKQPAVAVPQEAADSIRSPFNACCNKEHCRAMLAAQTANKEQQK